MLTTKKSPVEEIKKESCGRNQKETDGKKGQEGSVDDERSFRSFTRQRFIFLISEICPTFYCQNRETPTIGLTLTVLWSVVRT